mgnify:CR=1 FL=1
MLAERLSRATVEAQTLRSERDELYQVRCGRLLRVACGAWGEDYDGGCGNGRRRCRDQII